MCQGNNMKFSNHEGSRHNTTLKDRQSARAVWSIQTRNAAPTKGGERVELCRNRRLMCARSWQSKHTYRLPGYTGVYRRKKGRRSVVLVAWQGIKVNERAGATYYFSRLGSCPLPVFCPVIPPFLFSSTRCRVSSFFSPSPLRHRARSLPRRLFLANAEPPRAARTSNERERPREPANRARGMFRDNAARGGGRGGRRRDEERTDEVASKIEKEKGGGERNGSQEKGEVADLELPRSSGRLHPASSCAPREKDTLCSLASDVVSRNPLNSYVPCTNWTSSKDADRDQRDLA